MADDWRKFAAAAVNEKDSAKLRVLVEKLIEGLSEEQQRVRRSGRGLLVKWRCFNSYTLT